MNLPKYNVTGIYKITSPKNRIYIGQALCIRKRWAAYKNGHHKTQPLLSRSLNKYGVDNHKFEILTTCSIEELNDLERYYQEVYNVLDKRIGLNLRYTASSDRSGHLSDEHKANISKSLRSSQKFQEAQKIRAKNRIGYKMSERSKAKMREKKKNIYNGSKNPAARRIRIKNLNTLETFDGSMQCVSKFLKCDVEYVWSRVDELTKRSLILNEWVFMDLDKHKDYLDPIGNVFLDLNTGIYHFDDEFMDIRRKSYTVDSINNRIRHSKRYKKV